MKSFVLCLCILSNLLPGSIQNSLPAAVISDVDSYQGLIDVIGEAKDIGTGRRFEREGILLIYKGGVCEADFEKYNLDWFGKASPKDFALISADIDRVDLDFFKKFKLDKEKFECPTAIVIPLRGKIGASDFKKLKYSSNIEAQLWDIQKVSVGVANDYDYPIKVSHIKSGQLETELIQEISPGNVRWSGSFKTNVLVAKTMDGKELMRFTVRFHSLFAVAPNRNCSIEDCGIVERPEEVILDEEEIQKRKNGEDFRLRNNIAQPQGLPRFTDVGFKKIRVPDDVWDALYTYYEFNKNTPKVERWNKGNVYTNNLEAPSYMVELPENGPLKPYIFEGLRPILEEWSGVDLVKTACYGIRAYTNGSWLSNHVDTRKTHAISVIINVDQEVTDPWPLMIYDHAGNDHNITMAPRDMVLYESATCVHGRPSILNGKFYANMFVHYKPKDPENWI